MPESSIHIGLFRHPARYENLIARDSEQLVGSPGIFSCGTGVAHLDVPFTYLGLARWLRQTNVSAII